MQTRTAGRRMHTYATPSLGCDRGNKPWDGPTQRKHSTDAVHAACRARAREGAQGRQRPFGRAHRRRPNDAKRSINEAWALFTL